MTESLFAAPTAGIARVALPVPIDSLFDYRIRDEQREGAKPGHRVQVVFGGRPLTGVVCETLDEVGAPASHELSTLESVIDEAPVLSPAMLRMLREAAADILCPVGIALSAALPRGSAPRAVRELAMSEKGRRALRAARCAASQNRFSKGSSAALQPRPPSRAPCRRPRPCW